MRPTLESILKNAAKGVHVANVPETGENGRNTVRDKPKRSKMRNVRCEVDGINFHSKKEMVRYIELKLWEEIGFVSDLRLQVKYLLVEDAELKYTLSYVADFVYKDKLGNEIIEDVKPYSKKTKQYYLTPLFKKKAKLMLKKYGIVVRIY